MLYAYIDSTYASISNLKLSRPLSNGGTASFDAPIEHFRNPYEDFRNQDIEIYYRDTLLATGFVESAKPTIKTDQVSHISFVCGIDIALLTKIGGKSNAVYQDQLAIFVVDDILSKADWRLQYFEGFDTTTSITIDLRGKEDLMSQLRLLMDSLPEYHFRYGGFFAGYHTLDVGPLQDVSGVAFVQGNNLALKKLPQAKRKIYEIEAFGGTTDTREIYLEDAYEYDNNLASHPNYPIVQKADGTWVIRDLSAPNGDTITKYYANIKPASETPTDPEKYEAGYALWLTCVNEFLKANSSQTSYEASTNVGLDVDVADNNSGPYPILETVSQDFYLNMKPGQTALINGKVFYPVYNDLTGVIEWRPVTNINSEEMLSDISLEFEKGNILQITAKTGVETYQELYDPDIILAKKIEEKEKRDYLGVGYPEPTALGVEIVIETHNGIASDSVMSNGENAKLFSLNMPSVPMGATEVRFGMYTDVRSGISIETVQEPALPSAGYIGKINVNGDWTISNRLTLKGIFIFK